MERISDTDETNISDDNDFTGRIDRLITEISNENANGYEPGVLLSLAGYCARRAALIVGNYDHLRDRPQRLKQDFVQHVTEGFEQGESWLALADDPVWRAVVSEEYTRHVDEAIAKTKGV